MLARLIYLAIVILASFALGFLWGYLKKQRKLMKQIEMLKRLTPKLKWGEDGEETVKNETEVVDYLPKKLHGISIPVKDDEDTKTGERTLP